MFSIQNSKMIVQRSNLDPIELPPTLKRLFEDPHEEKIESFIICSQKQNSISLDIFESAICFGIEEDLRIEKKEKKEALQEKIADLFQARRLKELPIAECDGFGFFKKREFSVGTKLAIHADFHGNLSAIEKFFDFVRSLSQGAEREVIPIILGDLVDRGLESFPTLACALAHPKAEILRGNHESLTVNRNFLSVDELLFLNPSQWKIRDFSQVLQNGYKLLPLGLFVGCKEPSISKEYVLLAHGAFEPDLDFVDFLESPKKFFYFSKKDMQLSSRIQVLLQALPESFRESNVDPDLVFEYLENRQYSSHEIRMIVSALQVDLFMRSPIFPGSSVSIQEDLERRRNSGKEDLCSLWGRILPSTKDDFMDLIGLHLSQRTILAFLTLQSSLKTSVRGIIRGHDHIEEDFKGLIPVYTLPMSPSEGNGIGSSFSPPPLVLAKDAVLVLTVTGCKESDWKVEKWVRSQGASNYMSEGYVQIEWLV
ncbi:MAG: metallophosphoesterase [Chlamydiota bacterium]